MQGIGASSPAMRALRLGRTALRHAAPARVAAHGRPGTGVRLIAAASTERPPLPHVDHISSTANPYVKHLVKTRSNRTYRNAIGAVVLSGKTIIEELSETMGAGAGEEGGSYDYGRDLEVRAIFVDENSEVPAGVQASRVITVTDSVMRKITGLDNSGGVGAVVELDCPPPTVFKGMPGTEGGAGVAVKRLVALDGIQDPGNMGTLLRTAMALGWDGAFLLDGSCDMFNDKTVRASRGASLRMPAASGTWDDLAKVAEANGLACYGADSGPRPGQSIPLNELASSADLSGVCLVLGNEGHGLSAGAADLCRPVTIPMPGAMESLNVGVAGGIMMYALSPRGDTEG